MAVRSTAILSEQADQPQYYRMGDEGWSDCLCNPLHLPSVSPVLGDDGGDHCTEAEDEGHLVALFWWY